MRLRLSLFATCTFLTTVSVFGADQPPKLRLSEVEKIRPTSYRAALTLSPLETTFSGSIEIKLDVQQSTDTIWLNANKLRIDDAGIRTIGQRLSATVLPGGDDFIGFHFESPIAVRNRGGAEDNGAGNEPCREPSRSGGEEHGDSRLIRGVSSLVLSAVPAGTLSMISVFLLPDTTFGKRVLLRRFSWGVRHESTGYPERRKYIENNPVKAGLCGRVQDWPWSSAGKNAA